MCLFICLQSINCGSKKKKTGASAFSAVQQRRVEEERLKAERQKRERQARFDRRNPDSDGEDEDAVSLQGDGVS